MVSNTDLRSKLTDGLLAGGVLIMLELMLILFITPIKASFWQSRAVGLYSRPASVYGHMPGTVFDHSKSRHDPRLVGCIGWDGYLGGD